MSDFSISKNSLLIPLCAGGMSGLSADMALFPLDTIKTRLQSVHGLWGSGGLKGVYRGLPPAALGSIPAASLFFLTYEGVKQLGGGAMLGAAVGEMTACLVRVPCEVLKQRCQASQPGTQVTARGLARAAFASEGAFALYRGYSSTVLREIPFSMLQFPMWEACKRAWSKHQGSPVEAWQSAICGSLAGGVSAYITTPLDVAKTRIMLAEPGSTLARGGITTALALVWREKRLRGLYAGAVPRTIWMSLGGAIFLGVYDKATAVICRLYAPSCL